MTRRPAFVFCLAMVQSGCSLSALSERESSTASNHCEGNEDCPTGSSCDEGLCLATEGLQWLSPPQSSSATVLFDVALTSTAAAWAGDRLLRLDTKVPVRGGNATLQLPGMAVVSGRVTAKLLPDCDIAFRSSSGLDLPFAPDGSIPVRISFTPSEQRWGVTVPGFSAMVNLSAASGPRTTWPFEAQIPAGRYDIYVEPFDSKSVSTDPADPAGSDGSDASSSGPCAPPPKLIRAQEIGGGDNQLLLDLPTPEKLDLTIRRREDGDTLDGWWIDMLEGTSGKVISTRSELVIGTVGDGIRVYSASLQYQPVVGDDPAIGNQLVRLSPPEEVVAPTMFFERSALGLFSKDSAVLDQLPPLADPVVFSGQVIDDAGKPQIAKVTMTLEQTAEGTFSSFIRSAQTEDDGTFQLTIVPGTYRVLVAPGVPKGETSVPFASMETRWQVAAAPAHQAGRALVLQPATLLTGNGLIALGGSGRTGARGATVVAEASPSQIDVGVFRRALGDLPLIPRAVGSTIDDYDGNFTVYADPGVFDFSVRPPEGSGLAWFVRPAMNVVASPTFDLGNLILPHPVRLQLRVSVSGQKSELLSGAHIRAYALLDKDNRPTSSQDEAISAIPIAEGRIDNLGGATMLLPAELNLGR